MKTVLFVSLILWMAGLSPVLADYGVARPYPWAGASRNGRFLFKMLPALPETVKEPWKRENEAHRLLAYGIREDGSFEELWQSKGWFAEECFLSDDGRYLVRMGPWAEDQDGHTDLALAFYDRGVLLKNYRVLDLLKDAGKAENTSSHYHWQPHSQTQKTGFTWEEKGPLPGGKAPVLSFHLVMIDKTVYRFEVATAKVLRTFVDTAARSQGELFREEEVANEKKGKALYAVSPFKKDYEAHFELRHLYAGNAKGGNVWFDGPEWRAWMDPRKKYAVPCVVRTVFPIGKSGKVETSITPAEIDEALLAALAHPFVKRCMADNKTDELHLFITGDRLHTDGKELQEYLAQVLPGEQNAASLRPWAELSFFEGGPEKPPLQPTDKPSKAITAGYLNIKAGQLIYAEKSKWPWVPVLVDAKGERVGKP